MIKDLIKMIELLNRARFALLDDLDISTYPRTKKHQLFNDINDLLVKNGGELFELYCQHDLAEAKRILNK